MKVDRGKQYVHNIPAARRLRRPQTASEERLWELLRDRRLLGLKFRRQHAVQRFVVDFFCYEAQLAVEVDGGIHDLPEQEAADRDRQALLEATGIRFVRVTAEDVLRSPAIVLGRIADAILNSPSPAKSGEGAGG